MKNIFSTLIIVFFLSNNIFSQDSIPIVFEFSSKMLDISEVDQSGLKDHPLGVEVAKKLVLFNERYKRIVPATPTSPVEKTDILKPTIYNSIKKIDRYYTKGINKELIQVDSVRADFISCLNVVLICHSKNTILLEKRLKEAKTPEAMVEVYKSVILEKGDD